MSQVLSLTFTSDLTLSYTAVKKGAIVPQFFAGFKETKKVKTIAHQSLKELFSNIPMGFVSLQTKADSEMCCVIS